MNAFLPLADFYSTPTSFGLPVGTIIFVLLIVKMLKGGGSSSGTDDEREWAAKLEEAREKDRQMDKWRCTQPSAPFDATFYYNKVTLDYNPPRRKMSAEEAGTKFVKLLGEVNKLPRDEAQQLISKIETKWDIEFSISEGHLNIAPIELERVAVYWHEISPFWEKYKNGV